MMLFNTIATLLTAAILSNVVLSGLGLEVLTNEESRLKSVLVKSGIVSGISLLVYLVNFMISAFILTPLSLNYLNLLVIVLLMIGFNELYTFITSKLKFESLKNDKMALSSIVLLVSFMGLATQSFETGIVVVLGSLIGYVAFSLLITMIQSRIRVNPMLKTVKGLPILLIILGLIAMVISGLGGIL